MHGITKRRRRVTSSWNSGDRSIASQSIVAGARSFWSVMTAPPPGMASLHAIPGAVRADTAEPCRGLEQRGRRYGRAACASCARSRRGSGAVVRRGSALGPSARARPPAAALPARGHGIASPLAHAGGAPPGPVAQEQHPEHEQPEALHDRQRRAEREHQQRAGDDAQHAHEAREQARAHGVQADEHEADGQRQQARQVDQLRGDQQAALRDHVGVVHRARTVEEVAHGHDRRHRGEQRGERGAARRRSPAGTARCAGARAGARGWPWPGR